MMFVFSSNSVMRSTMKSPFNTGSHAICNKVHGIALCTLAHYACLSQMAANVVCWPFAKVAKHHMCRTSNDTPRSGGGGGPPPVNSHAATHCHTTVTTAVVGLSQHTPDSVRPSRDPRTYFLSRERRGPQTGPHGVRLCPPDSNVGGAANPPR